MWKTHTDIYPRKRYIPRTQGMKHLHCPCLHLQTGIYASANAFMSRYQEFLWSLVCGRCSHSCRFPCCLQSLQRQNRLSQTDYSLFWPYLSLQKLQLCWGGGLEGLCSTQPKKDLHLYSLPGQNGSRGWFPHQKRITRRPQVSLPGFYSCIVRFVWLIWAKLLFVCY